MTATNPNRKMAKTRINADGDVIRIGNDDDNDEHTPATASAFLRSGGTTLDVFGFNFNLRQFLILLGILSFVFGLRGSEYQVVVFGIWSYSVNCAMVSSLVI